jgi:glycosyltransferase involved in cell wall biosynthesis
MAHYFEDKSFVSRNGILELLTRINLTHADRIRVLSKGMREKFLAKYGAGYSSRVVVLPPRVELSRFSRVKSDWCIKGRPKVVIVGSITQRKGQLRFLQNVLPSRLDIEVWLVGKGPELDACKSLAVRAGAEDRVKFFGQMNHTEIAGLLPCADVMVLFSNMEGTPRVLMEGMAVGLPIITTNAGFCADVIENDIQGLVLGNDPAAEIVERLDELFADEALRARIGQAARARAEIDFDADKLYHRYRALIRETAEA